MPQINTYTPPKNSGAFITNDVLTSTDFTSDEKIFLSYIRPYYGLNLSIQDLKQALGFKNKKKIENLILSLERKTGQKFNAKIVDKNIYCFNENSNNNVDELVEATKKIEEKTKEKQNPYKDKIEKVIDYFNKKTGSEFRATTATTKRSLQAIFNAGYTVEDCKHVVDNQNRVWGKITHPLHKYLTPTTLFRLSKFEKYLNDWMHYQKLSDEEKQQTNHKKLNRQQKQKKDYQNADLLG